MKITIDKESLLKSIQTVQRSVAFKNTMPILSSILLKTEKNNTMTLMATDLETSIKSYNVQAEIKEEGEIAVPARYITEVVRKLPSMPINIEVKDNVMTIEYLKNKISLKGYDPNEFPEFSSDQKVKTEFTIPMQLLKDALGKVLFATGKDETKPVFTGVLFKLNKDMGLTLVATDTYKLALKNCSLDDMNIENDIEIIIPGETLDKLIKILSIIDAEKNEDMIRITIKENQVVFNLKNAELTSRLIEGNFPNYEQVIPKGYKSKIKINTRNFLSSIERALLLMKKENQVIKFTTHIQENFAEQKEDLLLITANTEVGSIHEEMDIVREGEPIKVAFNASYLVDVLNTMNTEEIYFEINGALSPGIVKPITDDENKISSEHLVLILPVRSI
ncbi:DNA polymerase III subunit beta [Peptococcaceae bacterium]|nr:DNA polymerase III subunit beta [Peptococcaceae bacterium]